METLDKFIIYMYFKEWFIILDNPYLFEMYFDDPIILYLDLF